MAGPWILSLYVLLFQLFNIQCQNISPPPEISGSYRAIGELSETVEFFEGEPKRPVQVAFEENYDDANQMSVFTIWEDGTNETFVENFRRNTTFQYLGNAGCKLVTKEDWMEIDAPPSLLGFMSDRKIRFALQKLATLDSKYLKRSSTNATYRGVPANMWLYEIRGTQNGSAAVITVSAYWSNSTWNTTGGPKTTVPLGYKITKIVRSEKAEITVQNVNIFAFVPGSLNKGAFEAREGLYCEGNVTSEFSFPSLPKMDAVSIHSEIALAAYLEVKNVDIWYDMKNKFLRIDMDRIGNQEPEYMKPGRRISSEYTSKKLGATFEVDIYKGKLTCGVSKLDDYKFEPQDIINPKLDEKNWDMYHFFGVNDTDYRHIGKTIKRNIPCHMFHGLRTDWPPGTSGTKTLWEWCLAVKLRDTDDDIDFRDKELPLVSLQIYFRESTLEDFPAGSSLVHHFYDAIAEDPNVMYATAFDISRCFAPAQRKRLQFTVDIEINETNVHILENATSDPTFIKQWTDQIYAASKLTLDSLRIANVRSAIYNKIMYITFTLLGAHPQLPEQSKSKSLEDTLKELNSSLDSGSVQIKYTYKSGESLDLKAKPKTLVPQVDPTTMVHDDTTQSSTTEKTPNPTTVTESPEKESKDATPGAGGGTVAGVTVAMLLVGISLGAGGTFYKYRGLPVCCRRA